jgi:hydrogenase maturation protease
LNGRKVTNSPNAANQQAARPNTASENTDSEKTASQQAGSKGKTLVLCLGNVLMGDEGVGVHVARALETHALPAGVECLDGGTGGFVLLGPLESAERTILVDAAADGNPPGAVTRTTPRFSRDYPPTLTAHDVGVKDLLDVFYMRGGSPHVVLYAIAIDPRQPLSMELSAVAARAAEETVQLILEELREPAL